jgi:hypothetical protein
LALPANEKDSKQAQFIFLERFFRDGGSILEFIHRGATRWTSLCQALTRFLALKSALCSNDAQFEVLRRQMLEEWPENLAADIFQNNFYIRLGGYLPVLDQHRIAQEELQTLKRPTGSRVIPVIGRLLDYFGQRGSPIQGVDQLHIAMESSLSKRTQKWMSSGSNYLKASLVDPSQWIRDECFDELHKSESVWDKSVSKAMAEAQVQGLRKIIENSKMDATHPDPLSFFKTLGPTADMISTALIVVRNLLAIPAGESHCERVFSWADGFITKLRNRTANHTLEMQIVLYALFNQSWFNWNNFRTELLSGISDIHGKRDLILAPQRKK